MLKAHRDILDIIKKGIEAVIPSNIIKNSVSYSENILYINGETYNLNLYKDLYIVGSGKASIEMAKALKNILKERVKEIFIISNYKEDIENFNIFVSSHPIPDERSIEAANELINFLSKMKKDDFVVYLLSGGSSALVELPRDGVTLNDIIKTTNILLAEGLTIEHINEIRKKLSKIKSGKLNNYITCFGVVLVLSDVIGDKLNVIGSAPLFYKKSDIDINSVIEEYRLYSKLDSHILNILYEVEPVIENKLKHIIIGNNLTALKAASIVATSLGYKTEIITDTLRGEASAVAKAICAIGEYRNKIDNENQALIFGGETTVIVKGNGIGGRNQELVLSALAEMREIDNITIAASGTDGVDGPTDASGAIASKAIYDAAIKANLNIYKYLNNNDSYHFFDKVHAHIKLGHTGTNVCDIVVMLIEKNILKNKIFCGEN